MDKEIIKKYSKLNTFNVSRETCYEFESLISMVLDKNREINIISKENANNDTIRERHIIDSAQIIDFSDFKYNTTCDIYSGGGMPVLVIAIMIKNLKKKMKIVLYEKSYHKSIFLKEVSRSLNLDTEVIQRDIFKENEIKAGKLTLRDLNTGIEKSTVIKELVNEIKKII